LTTGDLVRVKLRRETTTDQVTYHNYLYEVERIGKNVSGIVDLDLVHFPVNQNGESLLALAVDAAEGEGIIVDTGREDFSCDSGATIDDDGTEGTGQGGTGYRVPLDNSGEPQGAVDNPSDPYTGPLGNGITGDPAAGSTLETQPVCATAQVNWYKIPKNANTWNAATGQILDYSAKVLTKTENLVGGNPGSLVLTTEDIDYIIYAEWRCADPSQPDGYGVPVPAGNTTPIEPDILSYDYVRWVGQKIINGQSTAYTSGWNNISAFTNTTTQFLTIGPLSQCSFLTNVGFVSSSPFFAVPAVGPVPWRSKVETSVIAIGSGEYAIGGLSSGSNAGNTCAGIDPSIRGFVPSTIGDSYALSGNWEFSNDQSTVLAEWEGRE
jgi:hypothetical protein